MAKADDADPRVGPSKTDEEQTAPVHGGIPGGAATAPFPIIGIGSSAGGYEALLEMLKEIRPEPGCAFVIIQHQDPKQKSQLASLLAPNARLPVVDAKDGMRIEADQVIVLPSSVDLHPEGRDVVVVARPDEGRHRPIDRVFHSLATTQRDNAIGIVLSGTLSDGTDGLAAIKAHGGFTLAQDPATAKFGEMPRRAIEAGNVDLVLAPRDMAKQIERLTTSTYLQPARPETVQDALPATEDTLQAIFRLLRKRTTVDFAPYKRTTLLRRLHRRVLATKHEDAATYLAHLRAHPEELDALFDEFLLTVTRFFRDESVFKALADDFIPKLLAAHDDSRPIRVWVPGCATGEEAYSLAILVHEALHDKGLKIPLQIFGTDVSPNAIQRARDGVFPESIHHDVGNERLKRWFDRREGGYRVSKTIRGICVFAVHDLGKDPPFSNMDLVSCRNVLIYMQPRLQRRVLSIIHYALKPQGHLLLGSSESIGRFSSLFSEADRANRLYGKSGTSPPLSELTRIVSPAEQPSEAGGRLAAPLDRLDVRHEADRVLIEMFSPPGVIVDGNLNVLEFRGDTSRYFGHGPGAATLSLMKMAREGLGVELRSAVKKAHSTGESVLTEGIRFRGLDGDETVTARIVPLDGPTAREPFYLLLFATAGGPVVERAPAPRRVRPPAEVLTDEAEARTDAEHVEHLERELEATRDYLRSLVQDYEATNEELRSANEEALSANEELQSTNEELETAKEELQSTNEELSTINEELQQRNADVQRANNDLVNLLESVHIPIVMLGPDMRLRRFTKIAETRLNLIPGDVGRPFSDINHNLNVDDLDERLHHVFETFQMHEAEVTANDGRPYLLQLHPYKTADKRIAGVVIALLDRPQQ